MTALRPGLDSPCGRLIGHGGSISGYFNLALRTPTARQAVVGMTLTDITGEPASVEELAHVGVFLRHALCPDAPDVAAAGTQAPASLDRIDAGFAFDRIWPRAQMAAGTTSR